MTTLNIEVVRNENGAVDINVTLYNVENQLLALQAREESQGDAIGRFVHEVFDEHLGKKMTVPSLQASVLHKMMQSNPEQAADIMSNYKDWQDAVRTFIRGSDEFDVAKGYGGGAYRVCDVPPKEKKGK